MHHHDRTDRRRCNKTQRSPLQRYGTAVKKYEISRAVHASWRLARGNGETEKREAGRSGGGGESSAARNGEKRVGATFSLSLSTSSFLPLFWLSLRLHSPTFYTHGRPPPPATTTPPPAQPLSLAARPHRRGGRVVVVVVVRKVAQNESDLAGTARDRRLRVKTQTHYPLRCSVVTQWIF